MINDNTLNMCHAKITVLVLYWNGSIIIPNLRNDFQIYTHLVHIIMEESSNSLQYP